ncbi:hypothetical protein ACH518_06795 [Methylomonas sp. HW2-6]|uniref:hypothetical protein n=1 Tax=Methylomonas sp. HW2-6 TaxID=3376687 RepID=UPI0040424B38
MISKHKHSLTGRGDTPGMSEPASAHAGLNGGMVCLAFLLGATLGSGAAWLGLTLAGWAAGSGVEQASPILALVLLALLAVAATRPAFYAAESSQRPPLEFIVWVELGMAVFGGVCLVYPALGALAFALWV